MAPTLVLKAKVAVLPTGDLLQPAYVTISDGVIQNVSDSGKHDADLGEMILFPGFVNAHCHLELTDLGPLPKATFTAWVENLMQTLQTNKDFNAAQSVKNGLQKLLLSGVTTVFDHISPTTLVKAYEDAPVRVVAFGEVMGSNKDVSTWFHTMQRVAKTRSSVPYHLTPHSLYSIHQDILQKTLEEGGPFSIHMSESADEKTYFENKDGPLKDFITKREGEQTCRANSPWQTLKQDANPLPQSLIVHGNDLSEAEMTDLATQGHCVVHCPGSFAYFEHENFPYDALKESGVKIALGTDSLASNQDLSLLHEIQLFLKNFPEVTLPELLPLMTTNACETIGLENVGKIEAGYSADLVGFEMNTDDPLEILKSASQANFVMNRGTIVKPN